MASHFDAEDNDSLNAKIDQKAAILFRARENKPRLQVTKCFKKTEDGRELVCVERNQDVTDISELKALQHVRVFILYNSSYRQAIG
jgi:hypothetical protein